LSFLFKLQKCVIDFFRSSVYSLTVGRLRPTPHSPPLSPRAPPSPPVRLSPPTANPVQLVPRNSLPTHRSRCLSLAFLPPIRPSIIQGRSLHWDFFPPTSTTPTSPRGSLITLSTSPRHPGQSTVQSSLRLLPPSPPRPAWSSLCVRRPVTGAPQAQGATPAPWIWTTRASSLPSRRGDSWALEGQDWKDTGTTTWHNLGHSWAMAL